MQVSKTKTIAKTIVYILVAALLIGAIGFVYKYTNEFNEDFKTFYLEHNGEKILSSDSKMSIKPGDKYSFDVKYTFSGNATEEKGYNVKVLPNPDKDFAFTIAGGKFLFSKEKDLSRGFGIKKNETSFELNLPEDFSIQSVLDSIYANEVIVPEDALEGNPYPFILVVSSYNESVVYNIKLGFSSKITGVELDKDTIVFGPTDIEVEPQVEPDLLMEEGQFSINNEMRGENVFALVDFKCQDKANVGDAVEFTLDVVNLSDQFENYEATEVSNVVLLNSDTGVEIQQIELIDGYYSFVMPECNVTIIGYLVKV